MGADEQSGRSFDFYFSWGTVEPKYSHSKQWKSQGLGYTSVLFGLHYLKKKKSLDSVPMLHGTQLSFTPLTGFIIPEWAPKMFIITKDTAMFDFSFSRYYKSKKAYTFLL